VASKRDPKTTPRSAKAAVQRARTARSVEKRAKATRSPRRGQAAPKPDDPTPPPATPGTAALTGETAAKPTPETAPKSTRKAAPKPTKRAAPKPTKQAAPKPTKQAAPKPTNKSKKAPPARAETSAPTAPGEERDRRVAPSDTVPRVPPPSTPPHGSGPPPPIEGGPKPVAAIRAYVSEDQATTETQVQAEAPPAEPPPSIAKAREPLPPAQPEPPSPPAQEPPTHEEHFHHGPLHAGIPSMYVVQITSELAPVAKVGGLADVVFGLTRELQMRGNSVEVILPKYDCLRYDHIWGLHVCYQDLWVPWWGGQVHCSVWYGEVHGRKCYFIEPHHQENYFNRGHFYGSDDDHLRFAFFSRAAMEFLHKSGKHPEVIHCHDWQTGLVPVYLYEIYQHLGVWHPRVVFTIHNFKHQGVTGEYLLWATELGRPEYYFHHDRLGDNHHSHAINMMKGGIVYSNFVTTVSPNHAWEAKAGQGHGLEPTLHVHEGKYGGVVNGVDYDEWNPEVDRYIPHRYGIYNIDDKYRNKQALRNRLWLADCAKPIVAYIGRLDDQKGLDLVRHALFYSLGNNAQFVLLGSAPDPRVGHDWWSLKQHLNDNQDCHIELGFNEELSHLIYAGADLVVVPSKFEPCGLTQLVAMRYGTVPVVRAVGGLADTVFDKDYDWRPLHERNGYVFQHYNNQALEVTLHRAFACYWDYPEHFRHLMLNGMRYDYSWNIPGQHYLNIYDYVRDK
jgi:starch synthase